MSIDLLRCQLYDLSGAVRYLHCYQKVIHGNIRASSVSVSLAGSPKLGNFSAAVRERDAQPLCLVEDDEAVRWQSPELYLPKAKPSFKSDVYAFGLTICEVRRCSRYTLPIPNANYTHRSSAETSPSTIFSTLQMSL